MILGCVLAGGQASRFGSDKALAQLEAPAPVEVEAEEVVESPVAAAAPAETRRKPAAKPAKPVETDGPARSGGETGAQEAETAFDTYSVPAGRLAAPWHLEAQMVFMSIRPSVNMGQVVHFLNRQLIHSIYLELCRFLTPRVKDVSG